MGDGRTTLPKVLWCVLGAGLLARFALAVSSLPTLITLNIPDDAFYYFKIAQNIASYHTSSLDGLHPTNGYHPLWMGVLVVLFRILPANANTVVHFALALQAVMDVSTGWFIFLLVREFTVERRWAVVAAALYLLNANAVFYQTDGLETALSTLLAVMSLYFYLPLTNEAAGGWAERAKFAILSGLAMLARTDTVFLYALLFAALAVREWRRARRLDRTIGTGAIAAAFVLPWLIWNYVRFGQVLQVSAVAVPWLFRQNLQEPALLAGLNLMRYELVFEWPRLSCMYDGYLILVPVAACFIARPDAKPAVPERGLGMLGLVWVALFMEVAFHCFIRLYPRPWYSALFFVLNAVTIAWAAGRIWTLPWARRGVVWALGFIFAFYILTGWATLWGRQYPWQAEFLRASEWVNTNTPREARIGAFNAGIMSFFAQRTVVNLDGSVNNSAYEALRARRLHDYLLANSISHVADFRWSVENDYKRFWDNGADHIPLAQTACFPEAPILWKGSVMQIYKVLKPLQGESVQVSPGFRGASKLQGCDETP